MKLLKCFCLIIPFLFLSCNIVDFGTDEISCEPSGNSAFFNKEYVSVAFSCDVDHFLAEQSLKVQSNRQSVELEFVWNKNTLYAKPETGWVNGRAYNFSVNGTMIKSNGSQFSVNYKNSFVYGSDDCFCLVEKPLQNVVVLEKDWLTFKFNREISYTNFSDAIKISPSVKLVYKISEDNKSVYVKPESDWQINTLYTWQLENLISNDNWELSGVNEGAFSTKKDIEKPELLTICPVSDSSDSAIWFENTCLDKNISGKECIGFIFSRKMDFSSIKSGISITPGINGYFSSCSDDETKYIFVPQENYEIATKYLITLSSSVKDSTGNSLFEDIKQEFYSGDSFLKLSSISIGGAEYSDIPKEVTADTKNVDDTETLTVALTFSKPIEINSRYSVVNRVSLNLNFPMTSNSPVLLSTKWDSSNSVLTLTWGNITKSTTENSTYYDLRLTGGKSGISTGNGIYMEESLCVHIEISS